MSPLRENQAAPLATRQPYPFGGIDDLTMMVVAERAEEVESVVRRMLRASLSVGLVWLCLILAGCGSAAPRASSPTGTAAPSQTVAPQTSGTSTSTTTPIGASGRSCGCPPTSQGRTVSGR